MATADDASTDQPGQAPEQPAPPSMPGRADQDAAAAPAAEQATIAQAASGEAAAEPVAAEPPPPVVEPEPARFCSRIGPFQDEAAAAAVRDYLVERGGQVASQERTTRTRIGYWVLVPPQASRAAAREVAAQLKAKGLEYWIIPSGELRNAISLGLFSGQDNADDFAKQMRGKGFDAEVREKTRDSSEVWLDYQGDVYIPAAQIRSRAPEGVTTEERDCP
jgi:cell division septation protein DedD